MPVYRVYGTTRSRPQESDWELLQETCDAYEATKTAHESEGTFWRRLTQDGQIILDRI